MFRGLEEYCPVHGERYCEEVGVECPWVLVTLGEEADVCVCPMTPQLVALKGLFQAVGVTDG